MSLFFPFFFFPLFPFFFPFAPSLGDFPASRLFPRFFFCRRHAPPHRGSGRTRPRRQGALTISHQTGGATPLLQSSVQVFAARLRPIVQPRRQDSRPPGRGKGSQRRAQGRAAGSREVLARRRRLQGEWALVLFVSSDRRARDAFRLGHRFFFLSFLEDGRRIRALPHRHLQRRSRLSRRLSARRCRFGGEEL